MYVPVSVCLHGGGGQRTILGVTLQELSILSFETGSIIGPVACELGSAGLAEDPCVCVSPTPGLQVHPTTLSFLQRCWGFNRGPYVCKVSTFLTAISPAAASFSNLPLTNVGWSSISSLTELHLMTPFHP